MGRPWGAVMIDPSIPVDELLARLKQGDQDAGTEIVNRFMRRLIGLARSKLDAKVMRKIDPEDVVQSVFRSYFVRQMEGEFQIRDWDNLWSLLALITARKCTNVRVRFGRKGRNVHLEMDPTGGDESAPSWEALAREPTPAQAAVLTELIERVIASLPERDRKIVSLSLEGKDSAQIGEVIGRAERTVRRTLDHFRARLEAAVKEPETLFQSRGT
jgi:RNA polymerase sigma factor (sigma-70 family)